MSDLATKVKAVIARRMMLQLGQTITSEVLTKEIGNLRDAVDAALKGTDSESLAFAFMQKYLPYGERVSERAFEIISGWEDALINREEVSDKQLAIDLGL